MEIKSGGTYFVCWWLPSRPRSALGRDQDLVHGVNRQDELICRMWWAGRARGARCPNRRHCDGIAGGELLDLPRPRWRPRWPLLSGPAAPAVRQRDHLCVIKRHILFTFTYLNFFKWCMTVQQDRASNPCIVKRRKIEFMRSHLLNIGFV